MPPAPPGSRLTLTPLSWRRIRRVAIVLAGLLLTALVLSAPEPIVGLACAAAIVIALEALLLLTRRAAFPRDTADAEPDGRSPP